MTYGPVAIFWDYENCSPQHGAGFAVVDNIRQIAHQYGSVKVFKAYLELSEQNSTKSISLRSELQSCGVSLTDCPHNGRKDVADKMMIVDMLTYAIDTPAPATIILISGDRDFVYAVSVLRLRQYHVVVVAPATAHSTLRSRASVVHDWDCEILRRPVPPTPHRPGHQTTPSTVSNTKTNRRHSFRESGNYSPIVLSPMKPVPQIPPETPQNASKTSLNDTFAFPNTPTAGSQATSVKLTTGKPEALQAETVRGGLSTAWKGLSPPPLDTNLLSPISPTTNNTKLTPPDCITSDVSNAPDRTTRSNVVVTDAMQTEAAALKLERDSLPMIDPIGVAVESVPKRADENALEAAQVGNVHPNTTDLLPLGLSSPCLRFGTIHSGVKNATPVAQTAMSLDYSQSTLTPNISERLGSTVPGSDVDVAASERPQLVGTCHGAQRSAHQQSPTPIPPQYQLMVAILRKAQDEGSSRMLRSTLAQQLTQHNRIVYQQAGVTKFKDYAANAQSLGLVELGGSEGTAWISLAAS